MNASVLDREQANTQSRMPNPGYTSLYSQRVQPISRPVQDMTPNRMPSYQPQNDYYTNVQSDNIDMGVSAYDMQNMIQHNAAQFAQTYSYNPYYYEQQYYNNVSANVETHPTNFYQPVQTNDYAYYQAPQMGQINQEYEYEKTIPQKSKAKNKTTKALIAVYFLIVAIAAALIIVNVVAAASAATVTAATVETAAASEDAVYYTVDENGAISEMAKSEQVVDYVYDTSTNWFDRLCDKIGNILG